MRQGSRPLRSATNLSGLPFAAVLGILSGLFAVLAAQYERRYLLPWRAVAGVYGCFVCLLAQALAPAFPAVRGWVERRVRVWTFPVLWCLPYLLYASGTGDWHGAAIVRLLAACLPGFAIYLAFPPGDRTRFHWQDGVLATWLIAIVLTHKLRGVWNVPANLDFLQRLFLIAVAAWTWTFVRPVPQLGYEARIDSRILKAVAVNFLLFAPIAMPVGFALHFNTWNPRWRGPGDFVRSYLEIFLFIAVLEEMFFRGFLQTLFSKSFASWWKAQLLVSVLFGLFHILHAPFPNWRYVLLATIAGWFYGSAFRQGGTLLASSLVHATVDTVWRTWFTVP